MLEAVGEGSRRRLRQRDPSVAIRPWHALRRSTTGPHPRRPGRGTRSSTGLPARRSEEHTSELQSLMRISYAVFCLKKKIKSYTKRSQADTTPTKQKTYH